MRVERVERFLSFPLTSGRKEKKKIGILPKVQLGPQYPRVVFFNVPLILELAFVWPHAVL